MRLREFANAEDQLALLKLIMDNTWAALATQAAAQAQARARSKAAGGRKHKAKPKRTSGVVSKAPRVAKSSEPAAPATATAASDTANAAQPSTTASAYPRPLPKPAADTAAEPKPVPWYQKPKELTPAQIGMSTSEV